MSLALLQTAVGGLTVIGGNTALGGSASGGGCNVPSGLTSDWPVWNPTNRCGGASCTNGATLSPWNDIIGTNNLNLSSGAVSYATNQQNGLPGAVFTTTSTYAMASGFTPSGTVTLYAIYKPIDDTASYKIFASSTANGTLEYRVAAGHQEIVRAGFTVQAVGTATLSTTSYTAIKAIVNLSTTPATITLWTYSAGAWVSDPLTTSPVGAFTISNTTDRIGSNGSILDLGYGSGSVTGIETYIQCKYALP